MNRASQTQFVNIQATFSNKKDTKPQSTAPFNPQSRPATSPSSRPPIQDTTVPKMIIQSRQGFNLEEAKLNFESQPKNANQPGEGFIMPKVKKPVTVSLTHQKSRVKGMSMEEVKKQYYSAEGKCRWCGTLITRKFRCHILDHIEDLIDEKSGISKVKQARQKSEAVLKDQESRNKEEGSNLTKRTFDELPNAAVEAIEKKHKGEFASLNKKIDELTKGLEDTQKQLKAVQKTHSSIDVKIESTQAKVKDLESNVKAISETVGIHNDMIVEWIKRSKDERGQKASILDRVRMKKDRVEGDAGEKQEKMTTE